MNGITNFPDKECFFVGREYDEEGTLHILEHFRDGQRVRIGEYRDQLELIRVMDEIGEELYGGAR